MQLGPWMATTEQKKMSTVKLLVWAAIAGLIVLLALCYVPMGDDDPSMEDGVENVGP